MKRYNPREIEPKWQKFWAENKTYEAVQDDARQKRYVAGMFPYPSGAGLHVGHVRNYSIVDAIARFHRQRGYNVMQPFGWDTFGLPAENYAIKTGRQPAEVTAENIASFKNQLTRLGVSIDWSRELNTSDPSYYRWTQWIFTQLFKKGLAYQDESLQWWCPFDKTVLANEQVEGGKCWRCGNVVEKKAMKQWFFKITAYADALLDETPSLDWPQKIKTAQTNWIGRSQGAEIEFTVDGRDDIVTVFTTRPDTLFGATFLVLAPEHPLARRLLTPDARDTAESYITAALKESEIDRTNDTRDKTGVPTGSYAINPATGERVPIWIADYVLGGYGTGAIMAVPAHDQRDFEFAEKFRLPIVQVVARYNVNAGINAPREGYDAIDRSVIDAIIVNEKGEYLLEVEGENQHFVGGGIESDDDSEEAAVRREVIEETGYNDFASVRPVSPIIRGSSFRIPKNKNQKTTGRFYEIVLNSDSHIRSEVDDGKHSVRWVKKEDVAGLLTWEGHQIGWQYYISGDNPHFVQTEGVLVNSGVFNDMPTDQAREEIVAWLEEQGVGRAKVTYKMRDWLISRQRYWGAPIPVIHCPEHGAVAVPDKDLPVVLPTIDNFAPSGDGRSPLAHATDWVDTTCPECGKPAERETDTMDGYACSSWYLLRYCDPHDSERAWDPAKADYWSPVDFYCGADHAVQHLLYVRFWTHFFRDQNLIDFAEPVKRLVFNGYINASDGRKMSKSLGNVVDPLELVDQGYGADALRVYELFIGPYELDASWEPGGIAGTYRFLNRIWTLVQEFNAADISATADVAAILTARSKTVKKVTDDLTRLSFNTAISALMEYTNDLYKLKLAGFDRDAWPQALSALLKLVAPFAPHIAAELLTDFETDDSWPEWDEKLLQSDTMTIVVQVNGKLRAKLAVPAGTDQVAIVALALAESTVTNALAGNEPKKTVYVPGRLLNFVA